MFRRTILWVVLTVGLGMLTACRSTSVSPKSPAMERIVISPDGRGFVYERSRRAFHPWGMNYGNGGRLMEDFWDQDWKTFAGDFREMKAMGANVVRVHLQFGKFMESPERPNSAALKQLARLLKLAEETGIHLDLTGLACYRPADVPKWYNGMTETERWEAQANFWSAVAGVCRGHPAVFCYNLINEPLSPAGKREPGKWSSGTLLGDYDFLQFIALDPAGRKREEIPVLWIRHLTAAIRKEDRTTMITVGLLPWSRQLRHLSGFIPEKIAPEVDFISVHIYPDTNKPDEALEGLKQFAVGKPVVIEETFPLACGGLQLEKFMRASREHACGWVGHYDGDTLEELDVLDRAGRMTAGQGVYRDWLRMFVRLKGEFSPDP
jgi:hypothetical protein